MLPNTCQPLPSQLQQDWNQTCAALKITVPTECAAVWQVFNQNSLQAFTAVTADALGADYQVVATSGSGKQHCPAIAENVKSTATYVTKLGEELSMKKLGVFNYHTDSGGQKMAINHTRRGERVF